MALFEMHVRPGYLTSEGAKHSCAAAAVKDVLDNAVAHGDGYGASSVRVGAHVRTALEVRRACAPAPGRAGAQRARGGRAIGC